MPIKFSLNTSPRKYSPEFEIKSSLITDTSLPTILFDCGDLFAEIIIIGISFANTFEYSKNNKKNNKTILILEHIRQFLSIHLERVKMI